MIPGTRLAAAFAYLASFGGCLSRPPPVAPIVIDGGGRAAKGADFGLLAPACGVAFVDYFTARSSPVHVTAYLPGTTEKPSAFERGVARLLGDIARTSGGKLSISIKTTSTPAGERAAQESGCIAESLDDRADTNGPSEDPVYSCIHVAHGQAGDAIKFLPHDTIDGLAFWIARKMRELSDREDSVTHRIGVLSGHGEISLSETNLVPTKMGGPSMADIMTKHFPRFAFEQVDLTGGTEVGMDLEGLLITQPAKTIGEMELRAIDRFVMRGKHLAVIASAVNMDARDETMAITLDTHGLESLLAGYGVKLRSDFVVDSGRPTKLPLYTQSGMVNLELPQIPLAAAKGSSADPMPLDDRAPMLFRIRELALPFASSLELSPNAQPRSRLRVVLRSSPQSANETQPHTLDAFYKWTAPKSVSLSTLGVLVEGDLKSAYAQEWSKKDAGVFVVASSHFLTNPFARALNSPPEAPSAILMKPWKPSNEKLEFIASQYAQLFLTNTILAFKGTLDWMVSDPLSACAPAAK